MEVELDVSGFIVKRALGTLDYRKYITCQRGWVSPKTAVRRLKYAKIMLVRYPDPDNWKRIRFSDEVHFGWGPQAKLYIIRKPGERNCPDYI